MIPAVTLSQINISINHGSWHTPTNWSLSHTPQEGEDVIVKHNLSLTNSTPLLSSCVISNARVIFYNWNTKLQAAYSLIITNNGRLGLPNAFTNTASSNRIYVVCSNFYLGAGCEVNANTTGWTRATGPGTGIGASYGNSRPGYSFGPSYGSITNPIEPGSGAQPGIDGLGGFGGGTVRIIASGNCIIHGTIKANGGGRTGIHTHGGSGGAIFITCRRFLGSPSGLLQANGETISHGGWSGSGGRIAVIYDKIAQAGFNPGVRFETKAGSAAGSYSPFQQQNAHGTVYFSDASFLSQNIVDGQFSYVTFFADNFTNWNVQSLTVSNSAIEFGYSNFYLKVTNNLHIGSYGILGVYGHSKIEVGGSLMLAFRSKLYIHSGMTNGTGLSYAGKLSVTGDVVIGRESWIYPVAHYSDGGAPLLHMKDLIIDPSGGIEGQGWGFAPNRGPGKGSSYWGGAGHGGKGGGSAGGSIYGITNAPSQAGSGGADGNRGGEGGSLIRIEARNITLNGKINASGNSAWEIHGGGGSGGGIFIKCRNFSGNTNGILKAEGGNGSYAGSGGGGGRIAVWFGKPVPPSIIPMIISNLPVPYLVYINSSSNFTGYISTKGGAPGHYDTSPPMWGGTGTVKFIFYDPPQKAPIITNATPTNVQLNYAYFNGYLETTGWSATAVSVFWGWTDGGAPTSKLWQQTNSWAKGTWKSDSYPSFFADGLLSNRMYYYRFYATNDDGHSWSGETQPVLTGKVWVETPDPFTDENGLDPATFSICRENVTTNWPLRVNFFFSGTATQNEDYVTSISGTSIFIPAGVLRTNITITPIWDGWSEGTETVILNIAPGGYVIAPSPSNTVQIADHIIPAGSNATIANGNWTNPAIWSLGRFPVQNDNVTIRHAVTIDSPTYTVNSCVISNNAAIVMRKWTSALKATTVTIRNNGKITTSSPFTDRDMSNRVYIICTDLTIDNGGLIDQNGCGYARECGPGVGSGASHGGYGGNYGCGSKYGITNAPETPGSGATLTTGGHGGGVVRIKATGTVVVNGTIRANGAGRVGIHDSGGSGGSIYITCARLDGSSTGLIQANGEDVSHGGNGGGGGRVAVVYDPLIQAGINPEVRIEARGGTGGYNSRRQSAPEDGTIYLPDTTFLSSILKNNLFNGRLCIPAFTNWRLDSLTITGSKVTFSDFNIFVTNTLLISGSNSRLTLSGKSMLSCKNLILTNGGSLFIWSGATNALSPKYGSLVKVFKNMNIFSNCWAFARSEYSTGGSALWQIKHLFVAQGGGFDADMYGYRSGNGPGRGGWNGYDGGGSYGGRGADTGAGILYGSEQKPFQPGSGGGPPYGGEGGGFINIEASGNVIINGTLRANGSGGFATHADGGSGGGIFIMCNNLSGNGLLQANGGNGDNSGGAGGGGGRVAIWLVSNSFSGNVYVNGGTGARGNGQAGTIYWRTFSYGTQILVR